MKVGRNPADVFFGGTLRLKEADAFMPPAYVDHRVHGVQTKGKW
jgi:hypothetical protein